MLIGLVVFVIYPALTFGAGVAIGAMIHRGHPVRETPMRMVKARGEFVDRRV